MKRLGDDAVYVRIHKFPSLIIQFETVVYSTSSTEWLMPNGTTGGMSFIEFCIVASFAGRAWLDSPSACVLPTAAIPSLKCASTSAKRLRETWLHNVVVRSNCKLCVLHQLRFSLQPRWFVNSLINSFDVFLRRLLNVFLQAWRLDLLKRIWKRRLCSNDGINIGLGWRLVLEENCHAGRKCGDLSACRRQWQQKPQAGECLFRPHRDVFWLQQQQGHGRCAAVNCRHARDAGRMAISQIPKGFSTHAVAGGITGRYWSWLEKYLWCTFGARLSQISGYVEYSVLPV